MPTRRPAAPQKLLTGLIGAPIAHSASPSMHERAAEALGLRAHYQLIEVAGADATGLSMMLEGVRRLGFAGVNVTYPYKEAVVPLLDELAPGAAAMGAVNTVVVRDGRLIGHNTDITGFARAVAPQLAPADNAVAVIGAGGVGKAIAFALASQKVSDIRIVDSEPARAEKLASLLNSNGAKVGARAATSVEDALEDATGLINGTPVGMLPNRDMPVPPTLLRANLWVADAVYSPLITPLLAAARAKRARIMTGRELAIYQAVDAFELFTDLAPSTEVVGEAFDAVMAAHSAAYQAA
jgi:shikimate dehydrogenase